MIIIISSINSFYKIKSIVCSNKNHFLKATIKSYCTCCFGLIYIFVDLTLNTIHKKIDNLFCLIKIKSLREQTNVLSPSFTISFFKWQLFSTDAMKGCKKVRILVRITKNNFGAKIIFSRLDCVFDCDKLFKLTSLVK